MTKAEKIKTFDPNGVALSEQLFGLPFTESESETVILPVPWEVTVSYATGTAQAPDAIAEASLQVDLFDPFLKDAWKHGIFMKEIDTDLQERSNKLRKKAEKYIDSLTNESDFNDYEESLEKINKACAKMVKWVEAEMLEIIDSGKNPVLLGGDHSTPLGFIKALSQKHKDFGILQIDAHADLRNAYEGFTYSHASIMFNALKVDAVSKLVQVGIRDYCEEEAQLIEANPNRISCYYDRDLKAAQYKGENWNTICEGIIEKLPQKVYVSFDIDGLDPKLCPNTGTPVAGGFETEEVLFLLEKVVESGHEIIGFDLNEVAPGKDEWDANVGARLLYRLCNIMVKSKSNIS